ncbi:MAG: DMT family protein [Bdellovibrionales bacterium]
MLSPALSTVLLLTLSNIFMTFAWYGHLKNHRDSVLWIVILVSWGIAFFEYCLQVPANRIGSQVFSLPQLKILQEVITMVVFAGFSTWYMRQPLKLDYLWASLCLIGAIYFIFRSPAAN